jgi:putative DNA primase/helicase
VALVRNPPGPPLPLLAVSGPAGAAKSSFAEFARSIIDPNDVLLAGNPRGQDLVAYAKNNPVLCFDNLSAIGPSLADDLCRLATGGGLGGRRLYTNDEEATFKASRPMILTGINDLATRGDLADRTLVIRLEPIPEAARRTAAEMQEAFEYAHPRVLAGLLDMVVKGLRRKEEVQRQRRPLPRMADFAQWGFAVAPALGWTEEDFTLAYRRNHREANDAVIEDDPIAQGILALLDRKSEKTWQGTTQELWKQLRAADLEASRAPNFPQSPEALGKALKRIEPALADRGVTIERKRISKGTQITLSAR